MQPYRTKSIGIYCCVLHYLKHTQKQVTKSQHVWVEESEILSVNQNIVIELLPKTVQEVKKALFSAAHNKHHKHTNYTKYAMGEGEREYISLMSKGKLPLTVTSDQNEENSIFKKSSILLKHYRANQDSH